MADHDHLTKVVGKGIVPQGTKAPCSVCGEMAVQVKAPSGGAWRHVK